MTPEELVGWAVIGLGLLLSSLTLRATFYFGEHRRALIRTDGYWVFDAVYRVCVSITIVCLGFTLARVAYYAWGTNVWIQLAQAVLTVWLLLIPYLLMRLFKAKEGRLK